ncbi:MAG: aldehyde dehydrogenase family protein [Thermoplasmatota archaeon]
MPAKFRNESTHFRASKTPKGLADFNEKFEAALKKVRANIGETHPMLIDGEEVAGDSVFADTNPANTSEVLGYFQKGDAEDVGEAVKAAKEAQPAWERVAWTKRAAIFEKASKDMARRKYELAAIMCLENGKNRIEAMYDVDEAIDFLGYYASRLRAERGFVQKMGEAFPGEKCETRLRPWGVFGVVAPFNFPLAIPTGMTTGALITGNAAVLKPASDTPWLSLELVRILHGAGVPKGVLHYVTGGGSDVGQALMDHPDLDGIVFTGSRDVGVKNFGAFVTARPRPYICEMGGKNAIVVTAKADLDRAADGVVKSAFGFGGQKCSACSRAYVHESVHDAFVAKLAAKTKALKVGPPEHADASLGPIINAAAVRTFADAVDLAKRDGGKVLAGGRVLKDGAFGRGNFVEPTVVDGLPRGHELFRRELFVPFVALATFTDLGEVIDEVNAADYGLTSGVFSRDKKEIARYFDDVEAGVVYANRARGGSTGAMVGAQSFGGWKFSGTTDRGAGGPWYLHQFMREQSRTVATK